MWYVFDTDKDAELISGFNTEMTKEKYLEFFNNKKLTDILNFEKVNAGDVFYIPAGRIHALGPGVCLAEIQQTSDITYRIYDLNRVDAEGLSRKLHVEEAADAIDYSFQKNYRTEYSLSKDVPSNLVKSPYFTTNIHSLDKEISRDYFGLDSFVILMCVEGSAALRYNGGQEKLTTGQTLLLPADMNEVSILPEDNVKLLEVYIE
jgi:mannose-6-phosphate isomerase